MTQRTQHKDLSARSLKLAQDAVQKNVDLENQIRGCQPKEVHELRKENKQLKKELKEFWLIIEHFSDEFRKAGLEIPRVLQQRVDHHAPTLDSYSEESQYHITAGVSEYPCSGHHTSSSDQAQDSKSNKAVVTASNSVLQDGPAYNKYRQNATSMPVSEKHYQASPLTPISYSNQFLGPKAEQRSNATQQHPVQGIRRSSQTSLLEPQAKRRRTASTTKGAIVIDARDKFIDLTSGIDGSSLQKTGQKNGQFLPQAPWHTQQQCQYPQTRPSHLSSSTEKGISLLENRHSLTYAGNSDLDTDNGAWTQRAANSCPGDDKASAQASQVCVARQDLDNGSSQHPLAGSADMLASSMQPATEDWVEYSTFTFDTAVAEFDWSGYLLASPKIDPSWLADIDVQSLGR